MNEAPPGAVPARRVALHTATGFIAFGFGSGLAPRAPGTAGSAAAVPLAIPLLLLPPIAFWPLWIAAFLGGVYCCGVASRRLGTEDPGGIVWDEIVAMWLVLAWVPKAWPWWLAGFALFRLFDILKPWPICVLERRFRGGVGIMLDDIAAAGFALAVLVAFRA